MTMGLFLLLKTSFSRIRLNFRKLLPAVSLGRRDRWERDIFGAHSQNLIPFFPILKQVLISERVKPFKAKLALPSERAKPLRMRRKQMTCRMTPTMNSFQEGPNIGRKVDRDLLARSLAT